MLANITTEEVRDYIVKSIPDTRAIWEEAMRTDPEERYMSRWAEGRLDAFMQILQVLDNEEFDRLSEERQKRINAVLGIEDADDED